MDSDQNLHFNSLSKWSVVFEEHWLVFCFLPGEIVLTGASLVWKRWLTGCNMASFGDPFLPFIAAWCYESDEAQVYSRIQHRSWRSVVKQKALQTLASGCLALPFKTLSSVRLSFAKWNGSTCHTCFSESSQEDRLERDHAGKGLEIPTRRADGAEAMPLQARRAPWLLRGWWLCQVVAVAFGAMPHCILVLTWQSSGRASNSDFWFQIVTVKFL